jgi:DNA-binding NtrC family response regulator
VSVRVHYLDDEPELCEIFVGLFSSASCKIATFTDPYVAIEETNKNKPDIIFLDYRLPGTNGEEVAYKLPKGIPIYLMTGDLFVNTAFQFSGYFKKPFEIDEIKRVIALAQVA